MDGGVGEERNCCVRAWIEENPHSNKMLFDVPFKKVVSQPKETVKEINESFGMGFVPDFEQALDTTLNDNNTPRMVKFVVPD